MLTEDIREKDGIRLNVPNEEIAERMTYWESRKNNLKPFAECKYCEVCRDSCDFSIRASG